MKVGIFNPYWQTFGGGERYTFTVAEYFLSKGDKVDIFWRGENNQGKIKDRFNLDLARVNFVPDIFFSSENFFSKITKTSAYDLIFFVSDGSLPFSLAKNTIVHFQVPFNANKRSLLNRLKLSRIKNVVCNSQFTKKFIDRSFGVNSDVLYPPVDVKEFTPGKKENLILSVGRFFAPSHPKKQEVMLQTFQQMVDSGLRNWRLVLAGGITEDSLSAVETLKNQIGSYPIIIDSDISFAKLKNYYARAKIYWHAAGFGEDLESNPEKAEHFGITTVEAMAAGCVPVIFSGGGQREIITDLKNGYLWEDPSELMAITLKLINSPKKQSLLSKEAQQRSQDFSVEVFYDHLSSILK